MCVKIGHGASLRSRTTSGDTNWGAASAMTAYRAIPADRNAITPHAKDLEVRRVEDTLFPGQRLVQEARLEQVGQVVCVHNNAH